MRRFVTVLFIISLFALNSFGQTCCPQIVKSSIEAGSCLLINGGSCSVCSDAAITLSIDDAKFLVDGSQISWYVSSTKGFNPATGQGTLLGSTPIPTSSCDDAATVKFNEVMVKPPTFDDNFAAGPKGEWIEIIGPPGMSLACYIITDGDWAITIPPGYSIGSDGLFVVGTNAASGPEVDLDITGCACVYSPASNPNNVLTLDNNGEYLLLFDGNSFVDAFKWGTPAINNNFPFGDLVTSGQIPTADVIGCVQTVPFTFPSFESNGSKTLTNETYSRLPDYSGTWQISCPTIGKCNAGSSGIFPLELNIAPGGLTCNQTIYIRALVSPTKSGCTAALTPEYALFVSCPVKDFKKTLCYNESLQISGNTYDVSNPSGQEVLIGGSYLGCDSTVNIDLSFYPEVAATISGDPEICLGQTANLTLNFAGVPPYTFIYNINGLYGGTITTNNNPYQLQLKPNSSITVELEEVYDKNNCEGSISGSASISVDAPTAKLSGLDSTLCAGDTMLIPINFTGYPDYNFTYTLNGIEQAPLKSDKGVYYLVVIPGDTTIIKIKEMVDDLGCMATITGIDTLYVRPAIEILNLEEICNPGNTYNVKFTIQGGDPSTWYIVGSGSITDSLFISNDLAGGSTYTFIAKDGSNCSADTISNTVLCNCQNKVGSMDQNTLHACIDGTITASYDNTNQLLQSTDILMYILHDNSGNTPGFIYAVNNTPSFTYVAGMVPGNLYFISAVIGKELSPGVLDFTDECLRVAPGTPVIFHDFPKLDITGDQSICEGSCAKLFLDINGNAPFELSYTVTDKNGPQNLNDTGSGPMFSYVYCSPSNGGQDNVGINITSIKDAYCTLLLNEVYDIKVNTPSLNDLTKDLCTGQALIINGNTYDESNPQGVELITGGNYLGCDSIIKINLSFVNTVVENLKASICKNGNITINGEVFDQSNSTGSFSFPGGSVAGCDSILNIALSFLEIDTGLLQQSLCQGDQLLINGKIYDLNNPNGIETLGGMSWKGCDSTVIVNLNFYPIVNGYLNDSLCKSDVLIINGNQYDVNKPAGFEVFQNGSSNGCDSTLQIQLYFLPDITASISGPATVCPGEDVNITFNFSTPGTYNVDFDDGSGSVVKLTDISDGYVYNIGSITSNSVISLKGVISNENACVVLLGSDLTVNVGSLNTSISINSDYNGFDVSCNGASDGIIQVSTSSGTSPYTYNWSNGNSTDILSNAGAGSYIVTVTDVNGCSSIQNITLNEPAPIQVTFTTVDGGCNGQGSGELSINNIAGGSSGYTYSIDNGTATSLSAPFKISGLLPNSYILKIADSNGCEYVDNFTINQSNSGGLFVDAGQDITIEAGKQIGLSTEVNFIPSEITWFPPKGLNCSNCLDPVVKTDTTTTYTITVKDTNGCEATDEITVYVLNNNIIFIPNIFSPNADGINDKLSVFCSDRVKAIKRFAVFDRWGESLYDVTDIPVNDVSYGWDGKQRGSKANYGVYVYYVIVTLQDDKDKVFKGDFTLKR